MECQVSYSATVHVGDASRVSITTYFYCGNWMWFGYLMNVVGFDNLGCQELEIADNTDSGTTYYDNSEDAIVAAVAQFDGTDEVSPFGLGDASNPITVEDDYTGDVVPTGWDARDHKAMYE